MVDVGRYVKITEVLVDTVQAEPGGGLVVGGALPILNGHGSPRIDADSCCGRYSNRSEGPDLETQGWAR